MCLLAANCRAAPSVCWCVAAAVCQEAEEQSRATNTLQAADGASNTTGLSTHSAS